MITPFCPNQGGGVLVLVSNSSFSRYPISPFAGKSLKIVNPSNYMCWVKFSNSSIPSTEFPSTKDCPILPFSSVILKRSLDYPLIEGYVLDGVPFTFIYVQPGEGGV